jgi:hypothetical protein
MRRLTGKHSKEVRIDQPAAVTRREFLKSSALTAAAALIPVSSAPASSIPANGTTSERLASGWEYFQGSLGGVWDVWRADMTAT